LVVNVKLFALVRQQAGRSHVTVELPDGAKVSDLRQVLGSELPALASLVPHLMIAVNAQYAGDDQTLTEDAEVAAIPPVSGG